MLIRGRGAITGKKKNHRSKTKIRGKEKIAWFKKHRSKKQNFWVQKTGDKPRNQTEQNGRDLQIKTH